MSQSASGDSAFAYQLPFSITGNVVPVPVDFGLVFHPLECSSGLSVYAFVMGIDKNPIIDNNSVCLLKCLYTDKITQYKPNALYVITHTHFNMAGVNTRFFWPTSHFVVKALWEDLFLDESITIELGYASLAEGVDELIVAFNNKLMEWLAGTPIDVPAVLFRVQDFVTVSLKHALETNLGPGELETWQSFYQKPTEGFVMELEGQYGTSIYSIEMIYLPSYSSLNQSIAWSSGPPDCLEFILTLKEYE